jgi:hypothetical protein
VKPKSEIIRRIGVETPWHTSEVNIFGNSSPSLYKRERERESEKRKCGGVGIERHYHVGGG